MNVTGEELELVARGAGVTAEVGLDEVDDEGAQRREAKKSRGRRERRLHSRPHPSFVVVSKFRPAIEA